MEAGVVADASDGTGVELVDGGWAGVVVGIIVDIAVVGSGPDGGGRDEEGRKGMGETKY